MKRLKVGMMGLMGRMMGLKVRMMGLIAVSCPDQE